MGNIDEVVEMAHVMLERMTRNADSIWPDFEYDVAEEVCHEHGIYDECDILEFYHTWNTFVGVDHTRIVPSLAVT